MKETQKSVLEALRLQDYSCFEHVIAPNHTELVEDGVNGFLFVPKKSRTIEII